MRRVLVVALLLVSGGLPAFGAAPTAAQHADFLAVCMGIADNQALCSCKADAAMTLIDERFMAVVISSMKGTTPKSEDYVAYNGYVAKSNQICKPDY